MLAIDPGYIRWEEHDRVRFGIDHNLIAVDGEGPPVPNVFGVGGADGFMGHAEVCTTPEYAFAVSDYLGRGPQPRDLLLRATI